MKNTLFALLAGTAFTVTSYSQTLVNWDFTGATGSQVSTSATEAVAFASFIDAGVVTRGSGLTASAAGSSISSTGFSTGAIDLNDYYTFSLSAVSGSTFSVDTILFSERRSGTGIRDIAVRSSLDGFTSNLATFNVPDDTATRPQSVGLGVNFDNLSGTVEFRIYGFTAESAAGTWRLATLALDGSAAMASVPEPSTYATILGGVALVGVMVTRRRRG